MKEANVRVARPPVDLACVEERFADAHRTLSLFLEGARSDPKNLPLLISTALDIVCCGVALNADGHEVRQALLIAGQASTALFLAAPSQPLPVEVQLGEGPFCVYHTHADESAAHASRWLRGFFLCALCRDSALIDAICSAPTEVMRRSSTREPEYRYLFVDAVKSFWKGEAAISTRILAALEATDPDRADIRRPDWTLNIDVPLLQHLFYINSEDSDFAEHFPRAVEKHKKYWTATSEQRMDWGGYFALELTAIATLAYDRHIPFKIDSEYIPLDLVIGKKGYEQ